MLQNIPSVSCSRSTATDFTISRKIPIYVFFELTRDCNLRCRHCYVVKEKRAELSLKKVKEAINQLKAAKALILNFSGGEVLIRKDFFDIAHYARSLKFAVKVFTNGTLINKDIADRFAELKPLRVEITIFSTVAKIHDAITRVSGSFEKSLKALKLLSARDVPLRIKSPLTKHSVSTYKKIIKLAEDLGAKYQFDPNIIPRTDGSRFPARLRIGGKDLLRVFSDLKISGVEGLDRKLRIRSGGDNMSCGAGRNSCAISAYGDIFPCIILPVRLGNLHKQKFADVWRTSKRLLSLRSTRPSESRPCHKCTHLPYCNRCPGEAYLESGDMHAFTERQCEIAEIKSKIIIKQNSERQQSFDKDVK